MKQVEKCKIALREIQKYNPMASGLDAYLYDVAEWALENIPDKPNPKHFRL